MFSGFCFVFVISHPIGGEVISHCGSDLHFPNDVEHLFMCLLAIYVIFGKLSVQVLCSFLNWVV